MSKLIVIVAPSGTGKSTLLDKLRDEVKGLHWSVSTTTRPIRKGETDGVDYFYVSEDEFKSGIESGDFVEWFKVHSNFYGTSKKFIDDGLNDGKYLLFDLDVQGAKAIKELYGEQAHTIFIEPPSLEVLEQRLKKRATDPIEVINERLGNAKRELEQKDDFDYKVRNDNFDRAYTEFKSLVETIKGDK